MAWRDVRISVSSNGQTALTLTFIPGYWPHRKPWPSLEAEVHPGHSFQVDWHSVPNAPVYQERGKDLDTVGFSYRLMLSLLPKHVWRQRGDLRSSPRSALCMCECWGAHARWDVDLSLPASNQEDSRCTWELWVLVRHREPFRASTHLCLGGQEGLWEFVPEPVGCKCTSNTCLTNSRGHIQNRVFSVYARGRSPASPPPQVEQYGQISHISTCITLCTSHNWSTTVTGYIRCFSTYFLHRFYAINVT